MTECCALAAAGSAAAQHDQIHTVHNGMARKGLMWQSLSENGLSNEALLRAPSGRIRELLYAMKVFYSNRRKVKM